MSSDPFDFVKWYLAISLLGVLALPLVFKLFGRLPDRGYTLARTVGLLVVCYVFWLLCSMGILHNDVAGLVLVAVLVGGVGVGWLGRGGLAELRAWLKQERAVVAAVEAVFLAAFALMAVARAYNPQLDSTERPMDYMFINSILRSPAFPPHDAWLSGNPIVYYYFGYLMIAALTRLSGVASEIGFNLGFSMLFALTAVGALGVVMNLITFVRRKAARGEGLLPALAPALLAPTLVLVVGNFYGILALAHANGLFANLSIPAVRYYFGAGDPANSGSDPAAAAVAGNAQPGVTAAMVNVWDWLDLKGLGRPLPAPSGKFIWDPGSWWWFSGARVVHDRSLSGVETEAIDEMPAFSFIFGDMHPHVMALPFNLLAIALALDWLVWGLEAARPERPPEGGERSLIQRARGGLESFVAWVKLFPERVLFCAIVLGGLIFMNTWDFPVYAFLMLAALLAGLTLSWGGLALARRWYWLALLAIALFVLSVVLYLPYHLTAQSQVQGILPNLIYPTRFQQTVVMFGPVLLGVMVFTAWLLWRSRNRFDWPVAWWAGGGVTLLLVAMAAALTIAASAKAGLADAVLQFIAPLDVKDAFGLMLERRVVDSFATLFPALIIGATAGLAFGALKGAAADEEPAAEEAKQKKARAARQSASDARQHPAVLMALLMALTGALLLLGPEWVYVHDLFGTRMNTLFKFYYQAWILWALVSAFGLWYMAQHAGSLARWAAGGLMALAIAAGLLYTLPGLSSKANHFSGPPTLNGMAFFIQNFGDDWAAIQWLRQNTTDAPVLAEGVFGEYWMEGRYSRVSMATGLETILGWRGHEEQWHGVRYIPELVARERYVCGIYRLRDWASTQAILDTFNVDYVYVSSLERDRYRPMNVAKFDQNMRVVYQAGDVTIYRRTAPVQPVAPGALPDSNKLCLDLVGR